VRGKAPTLGLSGPHELVDPSGVAEIQDPARADLHRQDTRWMGVRDPLAGHAGPPRVKCDDPDRTGVVGAEEQPAAVPRAEPAGLAERDAGRGDGGGVPPLRHDRVRAVLVRIARRRAAARLVWPPSVVGALSDPVELVVARGTVLRLPQPALPRVEREAEGVSDAV